MSASLSIPAAANSKELVFDSPFVPMRRWMSSQSVAPEITLKRYKTVIAIRTIGLREPFAAAVNQLAVFKEMFLLHEESHHI